ncbi:MAG: UDP-N-acetylmuramate:L-alanyl-gamma-D-glutamyl-meso-diaminopimelate ligase [Chromatiales bacterium]|jgi:UDP-N-acetylmuramate: L-alanyl-gamma-D-glutamyl-meso-diaminopimelate ligase|nr:UDP-N-acetylmuramate:L-alanyl-gamma-D-glutamyl-meso-diaminopimelate ligase [Chromatiales bacterium]
MHLHILGICGTFMAGIARIARMQGHRVTGADRSAYPPMSTQLEALDIEVHPGYGPESLDAKPDLTIVGNALTRGTPVIERLLRERLAYISGPAWLRKQLLDKRWVLSVAGTHGKTSTASALAWILEYAGVNPGFLIGGVPGNFDVSARLGSDPYFVLEADEYDTAFFDKRAKFLHYPAKTFVINNLEHDHVDIYPDIGSIVRQFHHGVRIVPDDGRILAASDAPYIDAVMAMGCWSEVQRFGMGVGTWQARLLAPDGTQFEVFESDTALGHVSWSCQGTHNVKNALAAIAAAAHAGVRPTVAMRALRQFVPPARRQQRFAVENGITIMLDFAHHPTAVSETLIALRHGCRGKLLAAIDPRSNTMRAGTHGDALFRALQLADQAWLFARPDLQWDAAGLCARAPDRLASVSTDDELAAAVAASGKPGDLLIIMSNGDIESVARAVQKRLQQETG